MRAVGCQPAERSVPAAEAGGGPGVPGPELRHPVPPDASRVVRAPLCILPPSPPCEAGCSLLATDARGANPRATSQEQTRTHTHTHTHTHIRMWMWMLALCHVRRPCRHAPLTKARQVQGSRLDRCPWRVASYPCCCPPCWFVVARLSRDFARWTPELYANEHPTYYGMLVSTY